MLTWFGNRDTVNWFFEKKNIYNFLYGGLIMRIRDFIEELNQYDQDIELVIDVNGKFITPSVKKEVVHFKHDYSGSTYKDNAIVLGSR